MEILGLLAVAAAISSAVVFKDEGTIEVRSFALKGVKSIEASQLKEVLETRESSRLPWGKKHYFDRSRLDADLKRIQAFYADHGYPDARVTSVDVNMNTQRDAVDIRVTISEGDPVKVVAVEFTGFDVIPPDRRDELKQKAPLRVGQPRERQLVLTTRELALDELRDHGYPYAKVEVTENDGPTGKEATLRFAAIPGRIAYFGPVEIVGNKTVGDDVIRRELAYKPGELYRRRLVLETERRLYGMELFQFVAVKPLNVEQQPSEVPTRVTVTEGKHQRVNFGLGYGTEDKMRADAEYRHVNFLGGARSAGAQARWSSLDRGIRMDCKQPYFVAPHFSLGADGRHWYTYTPAYQSIVTGAKATLLHRSSAASSWLLALASEHDVSSIAADVLSDLKLRNDLIALGLDPRTGEQNGTLNTLAFEWQQSTADDRLNPHRGYLLAVHIEQAGRIVPGTFNYWAASADGRHYLARGRAIVWANRLQIGIVDAAGHDQVNVPFSKRYFLGGATSIRGWGRYEVSPLSGSGLPTGGDSMFAFTSELRTALHGDLGGVVFLDAGNVWADAWGFRLGDLRYAVGPGLRYQTPIGPARFDIGYQLNPIPGLLLNGKEQTRRWRIHFSIGQAF